MAKSDSKEVREQNLAGFRRMVTSLAREGGSVVLDTTYALAAPPLKAGARYFSVGCTCGRRAPFVEDFSAGRLGNPFAGKGAVNVACSACGKIASGGASEIISEVWQAT